MSADSLIQSLSTIHPKGFDLSLGRVTRLLNLLGDPHEKIPSPIHIAGTNGKGSTAAFCRAILEAGGKSVHVHTSPHLVRWHERFRLAAPGGGQLVDDGVLEQAISRVAEANAGQSITLFEILTASMFVLFSDHPADYSIVEVGLGGRFDATNVIDEPLVSIITAIGMDHQAYLGDRAELIAMEKAGIIKPGKPVVIGAQPLDVRGVLEEIALGRAAPAIIAGQDFDFYEQQGRFIFQDNSGLLDLPLPRLRGTHQIANAANAIAAIRHAVPDLPEAAFEAAMGKVDWPARMQLLKPGHLTALTPPNSEIWLDGGHNPQAAEAIAAELAALEERAPMPVFMIAGMLTTKEPGSFFAAFESLVEQAFIVPVVGSQAGFDPRELAAISVDNGVSATPCASVTDGIHALSGLLKDGEPARILICGSLYLAGEVLELNGTLPQ